MPDEQQRHELPKVNLTIKDTYMLKNHIGALIKKNSIVVDENEEGVIHVKGGLTLTDDSVQHNGTKYDIKSLDISEYDGRLFADHGDMWNGYTVEKRIGTLLNVQKKGNRVFAEGIKYAVNANPLALLFYNMTVDGFAQDFSIGTTGAPADEEDEMKYKNHSIFEVSQVGIANNKNAKLNESQLAIAVNSIEQAKKSGMDTSQLEQALHIKNGKPVTEGGEGKNPAEGGDEELQTRNFKTKVKIGEKEIEVPYTVQQSKSDPASFDILMDTDKVEEEILKLNSKEEETEDMTYVTIKNGREFPVTVKYKNAAEEEVETVLAPGASVDVSEDQQEDVQTQVDEAQAPAGEGEEEEEQKEQDAQNKAFEKMLNTAFGKIEDRLETIEKNAIESKAGDIPFTNGARKSSATDKSSLKAMGWEDRTATQINAAWDLLKSHSSEAGRVLNQINETNLAELKKEGVVSNAVSIGDFGNFVIAREMLTEIQGCRNDYTDLVNATNWKETLSTQFAWLRRSGDINMQNVEFCDDGENGNLKPISEYGATVETANLEELAAVTPVCNAATRFLAADLLGDVAAGYRNDYDRKRAQLVVARLEQAVEGNGNSVVYDTNPNVEALVALLKAWKEIAQCTPNGTFVMNTSSYASILEYALKAGVNGPLSSIFTTGDQPRMFGRPYLIVADDLLPSLDTAGSVTVQVEGQNVVINHAVFYANLNNFTGRTSGGLQYDLSTDAAYEENGTVKSAYQRNELVLRGSFFRGGAVLDESQVAGILAPGVS